MKLVAACVALLFAFASLASAQVPEGTQKRSALSHYNLEKGLAISGYDPVAYFRVGGGKAREGDPKISTTWRGVTYRFASARNRERFLASPRRLEPAFGGWCAWAMREGEKVEIDPDRFLVENGRLLLFYDGFFGPNTLKKWQKGDGDALGRSSAKEWQGISGEVTPDLRHHLLDQGLALSGYDPVSYFAEGGKGPAIGKEELAATFEGVSYRFATAANRERFLTGPEAFVPRYGGYCAWAMAEGKKVEVDPTAFALTGDRLHLFYDASKRDDWLARTGELQPRAERSWKGLHARP